MSNQATEVAGDMLMYLFFAGFMQAVLTVGIMILGLSLWVAVAVPVWLAAFLSYRSFLGFRQSKNRYIP
jgi:Flp pilus assembly protein TadB